MLISTISCPGLAENSGLLHRAFQRRTAAGAGASSGPAGSGIVGRRSLGLGRRGLCGARPGFGLGSLLGVAEAERCEQNGQYGGKAGENLH
jgi:hypothetical protein